MKKRLLDKAGVTVLEGVIALGLLALVMAGAFGVLLSASRQTSQPDIREEVVLAVDKANTLLKAYVGIDNSMSPTNNPVPTELRGGLCDNNLTNPLVPDTEVDISCLLPPICDVHNNNSSFTYTVHEGEIAFHIVCNGYQV